MHCCTQTRKPKAQWSLAAMGPFDLLFIRWISSDMDINAVRTLMNSFPFFSFLSLDCCTPFTYAVFIPPSVYSPLCNYFWLLCFYALSESGIRTDMSTEQKSQSPHVTLPHLFHSLTVCSSFLSLSGTLSQWFFFFPLKDGNNRHRQEEDHWDKWPHWQK